LRLLFGVRERFVAKLPRVVLLEDLGDPVKPAAVDLDDIASDDGFRRRSGVTLERGVGFRQRYPLREIEAT
jgi:hypothetical protein